VESAGVEPAS